MKNKYTKLIILLITTLTYFQVNAQSTTLSMGPGYQNQVFYSMQNGEVLNTDNKNWDIAFCTSGSMSSSIRINGGQGTQLYLYPDGDTSSWNNFNASNINSWSPIYNSDTNWFIGAFDKNLSSPYDLGWGIYSMITHYVYGDSIYAIKTVNGNWKKLWIQQLAGGEYFFKYANLDGTNENITSVKKSDFNNKNFAYFSLDQNISIDREPYNTDWDITFTKYITKVQGLDYGVTGVLSNDGIKVAQADNISDPNNYSDFAQHQMNSAINTIGYNWKTLTSMSPVTYSVDANRCYFVKDFNDKIWRIVFTLFEGSSTGVIEFNTEEISNTTYTDDKKNSISSFEMYPNPMTSNYLTLIYENHSQDTEMNIFDMTGKKVYHQIFNDVGFNAKEISLNLNSGIYLVSLHSKVSTLRKKLVVR